MKSKMFICIACLMLSGLGCVSTQTHENSLKQLEEAKMSSAMATKKLQRLKEESAQALELLHEEKSRIAGQLQLAQSENERLALRVKGANEKNNALERELSTLKEDRKTWHTEQSRLESANVAITEERNRLQGQLNDVTEKNSKLTVQNQALQNQRNEIQQQRDSLQVENQGLLAKVTTLNDEMAHMQQQLEGLEAEVSRIPLLEARVAERDREIAEREAQLSAGQERIELLEKDANRIQDLEKVLVTRDQELKALRQVLADREALAGTVVALTQERENLSRQLKGQREQMQLEEFERQRLVAERQAKDSEIQRLNQTHSQLAESLKAEIAKGHIQIQQVRDKLTINLVDKILFDSGKVEIKPKGVDVLKQVSNVLVNVTDKQIRIEGHTDNVPIRGKLLERFPSNWELSTARATNVVRYLIESGQLTPSNLTAVGHADTQPVAPNDEEEGRSLNRRIEIVLFPKDLSGIATDIHTEGG